MQFEGYKNAVREYESGGRTFVEKTFVHPTDLANELRALDVLGTLAFPRPRVASRNGRILTFEKEGCAHRVLGDAMLRSVALHLSFLHGVSFGRLDDGRVEEGLTGSQIGAVLHLSEGRYRPHVACFTHGDVTPGNAIFRGDRFLYFIDFEEAALSDPVCDLVIAAIECAFSEDARDIHPRYRSFIETYLEATRLPGVGRAIAEHGETLFSNALRVLTDWADAHHATELRRRYALYERTY